LPPTSTSASILYNEIAIDEIKRPSQSGKELRLPTTPDEYPHSPPPIDAHVADKRLADHSMSRLKNALHTTYPVNQSSASSVAHLSSTSAGAEPARQAHESARSLPSVEGEWVYLHST
jgi:hypothetical protein